VIRTQAVLRSIVLCCVLCSSPARADRWGANVAVASDHVVHGVSRTEGGPVYQADVDWASDQGWTAALWASTLNRYLPTDPQREIDLYLGKYWTLNKDWGLRADVARYFFSPNGPRPSYDYTQAHAALTFRELVELTVAWSPDYSGYTYHGGSVLNRSTFNYELSGRYPVTRWLSLTTGLGYFDLQELFGVGYWYWSAGAELTYGRVSVATSFIATDDTAGHLFGERQADERVTASLAIRLW